MMAAVFFYNPASQELCVGAAPHLQPGYVKAIHGFKIGPDQASCGTAVFRGERVINHDVATDPLWRNYYFATSYFRAVWSQPVFSENGSVLGTVAFYFPEPKSPDDSDIVVIEAVASLVALAIQSRKQDFKKYSENNFKLRV